MRKRVLTYLMFLFVACALTACGKNEEKNNAEENIIEESELAESEHNYEETTTIKMYDRNHDFRYKINIQGELKEGSMYVEDMPVSVEDDFDLNAEYKRIAYSSKIGEQKYNVSYEIDRYDMAVDMNLFDVKSSDKWMLYEYKGTEYCLYSDEIEFILFVQNPYNNEYCLKIEEAPYLHKNMTATEVAERYIDAIEYCIDTEEESLTEKRNNETSTFIEKPVIDQEKDGAEVKNLYEMLEKYAKAGDEEAVLSLFDQESAEYIRNNTIDLCGMEREWGLNITELHLTGSWATAESVEHRGIKAIVKFDLVTTELPYEGDGTYHVVMNLYKINGQDRWQFTMNEDMRKNFENYIVKKYTIIDYLHSAKLL